MSRLSAGLRRKAERGGVTILTVLGLLVLATVLAFTMGRNSLREVMLGGTSIQALKASEASEAGLDWFLLWSNKANWTAATSQKRDTFLTEFQILCSTNWQNRTYPLDAGTKATDRASLLTSSEADDPASSDMIFANSGTDYSQSSTTTGNATRQSFDLMFRCLGPATLTRTTSSTTAAGSNLNLFQVQATGKSSVPSATGGYTRFNANREMIVTTIP